MRRVNDPNLLYTLEESADLQNWTLSNPILFQEVASEPENDEFERVTIQAPAPVNNSEMFFRLKIEQLSN